MFGAETLYARGRFRVVTELSRFRSHGLELDMALDAGIEQAVHALRAAGIETYESCEGGPGHVFPEPTIRFSGQPAEGYRAVAVALALGLPIYALKRVWTVDDGELTGPVWEIVFRTKVACSDHT